MKKRSDEVVEMANALSHDDSVNDAPKSTNSKKRLRDSTEENHSEMDSGTPERPKHKKKRKKSNHTTLVEQGDGSAASVQGEQDHTETPKGADHAKAQKHRKSGRREGETKEERRKRRALKKLRKAERKAEAEPSSTDAIRDSEAQEKAQPTVNPESNDIENMVDMIEKDIQDPDDILRAVQRVNLRTTSTSKITTYQSKGKSALGPSKHTTPRLVKRLSRAKAHERVANGHSAPLTTGSADHAELLATKFMKADELAELSKQIGLKFKKGKFNATEVDQVHAALETYRKDHGLSEEGLTQVILSKKGQGPSQRHDFWSTITRAVPQRPMIAVYSYVRRAYNPLSNQGHWSTEEDDALRQAVLNFGEKWEKVGEHVGRTGSDCRDRYRNYVKNKGQQAHGPWSKEEEEELTGVVLSIMSEKEAEEGTDIFWSVVAHKMGHKRNRQQCRVKWQDELSAKQKLGGSKLRWTKQDSIVLIEKLSDLDIKDDSEVVWSDLRDETWNLHSGHIIGNKWLRLKRRVHGELLPFKDVLQLLRDKFVKGRPKVKSAALISDEHLQEEEGEEEGE